MSACRDCQAEVIFVPSAKTGKPMILDAKPSKGVVLEAVINASGTGPVHQDRGTVVDVYTDHHATCPKLTVIATYPPGTFRVSKALAKRPPLSGPDGGRRGD